MNFGIITGS